jgi:serine phosphatase RsbU (regulator of sigma subunit)
MMRSPGYVATPASRADGHLPTSIYRPTKRQAPERGDKPEATLSDGHQQALRAADTFFGGFCVFTVALTAAAWYRGEASWRSPAVIAGFLVANLVLSQLSLRESNTYASSYAIERGRALVGAIIGPAAYLLVEGPFGQPWWPGFLVMSLGGAIVLGLLTGSPMWGRLLVGYYVALMTASSFVLGTVSWYDFLLNAAVLSMVGLMFAQIMSLLGQSFQQERERAEELRAARDALFAEMEVAQQIQTLLLPDRPKLRDNVVEGRMLPAELVGGDYYDVITTKSRAFLAIGDVSGHGVTSGLTMMMARSSLIGALEADPDASLTRIYQVLNRCLCANLARMCVVLHMTFNLVEYQGHGKFAAVGLHLPIMVYRRATGEVEELASDGMWLGLLTDLQEEILPELKFGLAPGDLLLLYTDGIVEHFAGREMFGEARLRQALKANAHLKLSEIVDGIIGTLDAFSDEPRQDDVTLLLVNHRGQVAGSGAGG